MAEAQRMRSSAYADDKNADGGIAARDGRTATSRVAGYARLLSHPAYERLLNSEKFLRRLIPVLIEEVEMPAMLAPRR